MQKLIAEVKSLVSNEYIRAAKKFGPINHSDHESAAIIAEEVEEACDEINQVTDISAKFWSSVKHDEIDRGKIEVLRALKRSAILAACEAIQVAAVAYKAEQTINCRGEHE